MGVARGSSVYAAVLFLAAALPFVSPKEELSYRQCEDLGFTGLALCSDCNTFAEYVKDQGFFLISFFLYS